MVQLSQLRVLIVDDHSLTRNLVRAIIRHYGLNSTTAEGGRAALQKLNEAEIHLIICDWMMPDMEGIEVLRRLRQDARYQHIPFILLTAETSVDKVHEALEEGATDYIIKPFSAATIGEKLKAILRKIYPEAARSLAD